MKNVCKFYKNDSRVESKKKQIIIIINTYIYNNNVKFCYTRY